MGNLRCPIRANEINLDGEITELRYGSSQCRRLLRDRRGFPLYC